MVAHSCNPSYSGGNDQEDSCQEGKGQGRDPITKKIQHRDSKMVARGKMQKASLL
jgi:hypothetical protein